MSKSQANTNLTSAIDLFAKSYDIVLRNLKSFAILLAIPFIGSVVSTFKYRINTQSSGRWTHINFFNGTMPAYAIVSIVGLGLILFLVAAVAALLIQAMLTGLELKGAQGKVPSLSQIWEIGRKYWLRLFGLILVIAMYLIGTSIFGLIILVLLRNSLGAAIGVVLIIAAVLFVLSHYLLAPYAMIDGDLPVFGALEQSAKISKGHAGSIFSILGVTVLLSLTGIVPILGPIISFALGSIYSVAPALRYEELKKLA